VYIWSHRNYQWVASGDAITMHQTCARLESFCNGFGGQALTPGQPEYETARAVWNGAIDHRPAAIACYRTAEQVADAIRYAREAGLELSVRGGGHNYARLAVCDGGMMIHLGAMTACSSTWSLGCPPRIAMSCAENDADTGVTIGAVPIIRADGSAGPVRPAPGRGLWAGESAG
jgi:FAD binding domain